MNYNAIAMELLTVSLGIILLAVTLLIPRQKEKTVGYIAVIGLIAILAASFYLPQGQTVFFNEKFFINDGLAVFFKQLFIISAILVACLSLGYTGRLKGNHSEFFVLGIFALSGMMIMASANDFISLYIGLELMTIPFVILTAFKKGNVKSYEAGLKYVLLSAASSAILLYGMSMVYGISGSIVFPDIAAYLAGSIAVSPVLIISVVFVIVGFAFKISAVPFHMWAPDIYEGAPTPVTAFLAIGSKAAGFAVLTRLLFQVMTPAYNIYVALLIALAVLTMVVGNVTAIPQTNIKRLLAYSSIAHAGYILIGFVAYTQMGISAMLNYILLYIFANAGAFASIIALSSISGSYEIKDMTGIWKKAPFAVGVLIVCLLSLAGIPPAAGFAGKFFLFVAVMKQGYMWLALLAIGMSVVSVYYYITVIRTVLMEKAVVGHENAAVESSSTENSSVSIAETKTRTAASLKFVMAVSVIMTLIMGIYPTPFITWAGNIAATIFSR